MNNSVEQAIVASLDQFAAVNKIESLAIEQRLIEVFSKDMNFLEKIFIMEQTSLVFFSRRMHSKNMCRSLKQNSGQKADI